MTNQPQVNIARSSVASLLLILEARGNVVSTATGFVVEREATKYLITNFHVLSGRHPETMKSVDPNGAWPDTVRIVHNKAGALGNWEERTEPLYEEGSPLWLEHPVFGHKVDVVALPLTNLSGVDLYPHDPWRAPLAAIGVTTDLSIIGFPFGITGGGALGVWVHGSMATEPAIDFGDLPCFLIDSRTRPGQSGSPVIFYSTGPINTPGGGIAITGQVVEDLLGVYSGRINEESDLGFVWKVEALQRIVDAGLPSAIDSP